MLNNGNHLSVQATSATAVSRFIDTNTVVHEMLHAILGDVLIRKPGWYQASEREMRADAYATRLAMFGDGSAVRAAAARMIVRLQREAAQLR